MPTDIARYSIGLLKPAFSVIRGELVDQQIRQLGDADSDPPRPSVDANRHLLIAELFGATKWPSNV